MKKKDIIKRVADRTEYSQRQVEEVYDALTNVVGDAIMDGEEFKVLGFIKIGKKEMKPRKGKLLNRFGDTVYWERTESKVVPKVSLTDKITKHFK